MLFVEQPFRVDFRFQVSQHSIEWHGPRKNTSAVGKLLGVMEAPKTPENTQDVNLLCKYQIQLDHLLITNAVVLCADIMILIR